LPDITEWRDSAQCRGENPNIFFDPDFEDLALGLCKYCVVQPECLREAMTMSEHGIRGGTTEEERIQLRQFPTRIGDVEVIIEYY
jgi:hypothetical protein